MLGRREVAQQLLSQNADALACNGQGSWSLDMAAPGTPVWDALYEELSWRSFLEQSRSCQLVLVRHAEGGVLLNPPQDYQSCQLEG